MITAVDTNILIDCAQSKSVAIETVEIAMAQGALVICPIVYGELTAGATQEDVDQFLDTLDIEVISFNRESLAAVGNLWKQFLDSDGNRAKRILPDFLIGTHALKFADRLLTRDRGFYRDYFKELELLEP